MRTYLEESKNRIFLIKMGFTEYELGKIYQEAKSRITINNVLKSNQYSSNKNVGQPKEPERKRKIPDWIKWAIIWLLFLVIINILLNVIPRHP